MSQHIFISYCLKITTCTALGLTLFALPAGASPKADTNKDKQIDLSEFIAQANIRFSETDLNADARLTRYEIKTHRELQKKKRQDAQFDKMDINGDGVLTKEEHKAAREAKAARREARKQARADVNQDGIIDDQDRIARKALKAERRAQRRARKEARKNADANKNTGAKKGQSGRKGIRRDANGDGFITRSEYETATLAMFEHLDVNGDGVLTQGEGRRRKGKQGKRQASERAQK